LLPSPDEHNPSPEQSQEAPDPNLRVLETSDITQPPQKSSIDAATDYFYKYDRSISPQLGYHRRIGGNEEYFSLSVDYMFPSLDPANHWEIHVAMLTGGFGLAWIQKKHTFNPTRRNRFFVSGGLGGKVIPDQLLGTFIYPKNWLMTGAGGFERVVADPMSVRIDVGLYTGMDFLINYYLLLGWSWGF
jgi:hypothetical protein